MVTEWQTRHEPCVNTARKHFLLANRSTMQRHLQNQHSSLLKFTVSLKKTVKGQTMLTNAFAPQLSQSSATATAITRDISVFIAADIKSFSVVENQWFRRLLHTLEHHLSCTHFARMVNLYEEAKAKVVQILKEAESTAVTTDCWTSRGMLSYITITAHTINSDWKIENIVLQTHPLFKSYTGANVAEILRAAVTDCEL